MSRADRLNVLMGLLAVMLVGLITLELREPEAVAPIQLSDITVESLRSVTLRRDGLEGVELQRNDQQSPWQMRLPYKTEADPHRVERLLALLGQQASQRYAVDDIDLNELGFVETSEVLEITSAEGTLQRLIFGASHPLYRQRYIRNGKWIYLVPDVYIYLMRSRALDYVSPYLLPRKAGIEGVYFETQSFLRTSKGWRADPPLDVTSADDYQALIERWQGASALLVSSSTKYDDQETTSVTVRLKQGDNRVFAIVDADSEVVLVSKKQGLAWHLSQEQWQQMQRP